MNNFWQLVISPHKKGDIQTADDFMELVSSYGANKRILDQMENK